MAVPSVAAWHPDASETAGPVGCAALGRWGKHRKQRRRQCPSVGMSQNEQMHMCTHDNSMLGTREGHIQGSLAAHLPPAIHVFYNEKPGVHHHPM